MLLTACLRSLLAARQQPTLVHTAAAAVRDRLQSHTFAISSDSSPDGSRDAAPAAADPYPEMPVQQELVDKLLSVDNMNRRQRFVQRKDSIIREYQRAPGDTGSPEVQVALLTERIRDMTEHILAHKKDHVSKRGLQGYLNQRRKLLSYLRRDNFPRYAFVIHKLGLKDTYAKQERYDKYRVGTRLGTPAEPLKRYGSH